MSVQKEYVSRELIFLQKVCESLIPIKIGISEKQLLQTKNELNYSFHYKKAEAISQLEMASTFLYLNINLFNGSKIVII